MAYRIELQDAAKTKILNFEAGIQKEIIGHLYRLAETPTQFSRPSVTPPHPTGFQVFEFDVVRNPLKIHYTVFFKYGADEATLFVSDIGHTEYRIR